MAHRAQGELQALGGRRVQRVRKKSNHSPAHRAQPHPADHTHTHTHTPLLTGKHCSPRPSSGGSSRRTRARSSSTSKRSRRRCPCRPSPTTLPARSSKRRAMRWDVQRAACKSPHENRCTKGRRANRCMNMLYFVGVAQCIGATVCRVRERLRFAYTSRGSVRNVSKILTLVGTVRPKYVY